MKQSIASLITLFPNDVALPNKSLWPTFIKKMLLVEKKATKVEIEKPLVFCGYFPSWQFKIACNYIAQNRNSNFLLYI